MFIRFRHSILTLSSWTKDTEDHDDDDDEATGEKEREKDGERWDNKEIVNVTCQRWPSHLFRILLGHFYIHIYAIFCFYMLWFEMFCFLCFAINYPHRNMRFEPSKPLGYYSSTQWQSNFNSSELFFTHDFYVTNRDPWNEAFPKVFRIPELFEMSRFVS